MHLNMHLEEDRENPDHGRITWLPRTIVGWKGEVIFSNVSLCCVHVLPRLVCTPTVRGPAKRGSRRLCVCVRACVCVCQTTREREWGGGGSLPVTRKSNKGKKSSISPAKCTPGRCEGGRERARKRERLWTDNTPARLQIYNYQALRALPCLFLQPVKTNCSHVSITHILFLLIRSGWAFWLPYYFSPNCSWINTFL